MSGCTDFEVLEGLSGLSIKSNLKVLKEMFTELDIESRRLYSNYQFELLPNVKSTLSKMQILNVSNGILTGNSYLRMIHKLESQGLLRFFNRNILFHCEFGDTREDICRRALEFLHKQHQDFEILIVGDTPRDIRLGKEFRFKVVAVATGTFGIENLRGLSPNLAIENFEIGFDHFVNFVSALM
jgi:phosphoglycolate phosphatase-like HAD superfamily hydrolase